MGATMDATSGKGPQAKVFLKYVERGQGHPRLIGVQQHVVACSYVHIIDSPRSPAEEKKEVVCGGWRGGERRGIVNYPSTRVDMYLDTHQQTPLWMKGGGRFTPVFM